LQRECLTQLNGSLLIDWKVVLDSQTWLREPSLVKLPWKRAPEIPRKLKIGVIFHDGLVQPHPPVSRCLKSTVKGLEKAGHTIFSWDTSLHRDLIQTIDEAYFLDGGEGYHEMLSAGDEPPVILMNWILEKGTTRTRTVRETWKVRLNPKHS
jgi:amidase